MGGAVGYHHVRDNVPVAQAMRWFKYTIAEDEIRLLSEKLGWAKDEDRATILGEIEERFNILCEEVDNKEMEEMIRRTIERQIGQITADSPIAPSKVPVPRNKLDAAVPIPPELLNR